MTRLPRLTLNPAYKVYEITEEGAESEVGEAHQLDTAKVLAQEHRYLTDVEVVVKPYLGAKKPSYRLPAIKDREKFQVMPYLSPEEYDALKDEIRRDGVRHPILVDKQGHILDGHNRLRIWRELRAEGVDLALLPSQVVTGLKTDKEKRDKAIKLNMARRHLNRDQKRAIVENILKTTPKRSNRQIAELTGVSDKTVGAYRAELETTAEIPQFKKTIGADGKERTSKPKKPEHAVTLEEVVVKEGVPTGDAGFPQKGVVEEMQEPPEGEQALAEGLAEVNANLQAGQTRNRIRNRIRDLRTLMQNVSPEEFAREVAAECTGEEVENSIKGPSSKGFNRTMHSDVEPAQAVHHWLGRCLECLEGFAAELRSRLGPQD